MGQVTGAAHQRIMGFRRKPDHAGTNRAPKLFHASQGRFMRIPGWGDDADRILEKTAVRSRNASLLCTGHGMAPDKIGARSSNRAFESSDNTRLYTADVGNYSSRSKRG